MPTVDLHPGLAVQPEPVGRGRRLVEQLGHAMFLALVALMLLAGGVMTAWARPVRQHSTVAMACWFGGLAQCVCWSLLLLVGLFELLPPG